MYAYAHIQCNTTCDLRSVHRYIERATFENVDIVSVEWEEKCETRNAKPSEKLLKSRENEEPKKTFFFLIWNIKRDRKRNGERERKKENKRAIYIAKYIDGDVCVCVYELLRK